MLLPLVLSAAWLLTSSVTSSQNLALCEVAAGLGIRGNITGWTCTGSLPTISVCAWEAVKCDGNVTEIWLANTGNYSITGTLSTFIGELASLKILSVVYSDLHGTIPSEIGKE